MTVKTPGEILAENIEKSVAVAEKNAEAVAKLVEATSALVEKSSKQEEVSKSLSEVSEIKAELEVLKARDLARSKSESSSSEEDNRNEELREIAKSLFERKSVDLSKNKFYSELGTLKKSMLVSYDNSTAGAAAKEKQILGQITINLQTVSPITSIVNNVNGGNITKGIGYSTFDPSLIDTYESLEGKEKEQSELVKNGVIDIYVGQVSAKFPVSDSVLLAAQNGEFSFNPINQTLAELDKRFEKKVARQILNGDSQTFTGIFTKAHSSSKIKTVESFNANYVTLQDLSRLGSVIKSAYLMNAAIIIDRAALYDIYQEEADDGHLKIEQFDYSSGIAALRTPERVIPLIGVDSSTLEAMASSNDGFANYKSFADGSTLITTGYCPKQNYVSGSVTDNGGKAVAVLADFNSAYVLSRSTAGRMGVDDSLKNLLDLGYGVAGKIGYVGGKPVNDEAIAILHVKASS